MAVNKQETQSSIAAAGRQLEIDQDFHDAQGMPGLHDTAGELDQDIQIESGKTIRKPSAVRWWPLAGAGALILTIVTVLTIYLLAGRSATVDQLVILTVPSGAEVNLNGKSYGTTPVKIEQIAAGNYQLTITKENFEPVTGTIGISDSQPLEYTLKPLIPSDVMTLPKEERLSRFRQQAEAAFASGHLAIPYTDSTLYFLGLLEGDDPGNQFVQEMRDRVRK